jgi:ferredoxin
MSAHSQFAAPVTLEVDWSRCRGHGHCAELLPELVRLDPWGFPVVGDARGSGVVRPVEVGAAQRAVDWCPNLALRLLEVRRG